LLNPYGWMIIPLFPARLAVGGCRELTGYPLTSMHAALS